MTRWTSEARQQQREKMAVARKTRWKRYNSQALGDAMAVLPKVRTW